MRGKLENAGLDLILRDARSHNGWQPRQVAEVLLREVYDAARMGPTSVNSCPARFVFVVSDQAKAKLKPAMADKNVEKMMTAPVVAIIGYDLRFYELLPELFPHTDLRPWFVGNDALIEETAFRNGTLQGAYFMLAARALGLDVGPMSGFDKDKVNAMFWPDGRTKVNFICNIGYGDDGKVLAKHPRLPFEKACKII
jgi:3-hydroxypropanoate dehydrogenase